MVRRWMCGLVLLFACRGGVTEHEDKDGDGYCADPGLVWNARQHVCLGTAGFGDCNDGDVEVSPAADEVCADNQDNDCDGEIDELIEADADGDGFVANSCGTGPDCDDGDADIYPGQPELCDQRDNDCDGLVDEELEFLDFFVDADADGFGDPDSQPLSSCAAVAGRIDNADDCNDAAGDINPGQGERCNLRDDNCDERVDEGSDALATFYEDGDGDDYGRPDGDTLVGCSEAMEEGWTLDGTDCDDTRDTVHPDQPDATCDGIDDNCNRSIDEDAGVAAYWEDSDGDGYGAGEVVEVCPARAPADHVTRDGDCLDTDSSAFPNNPLDDDCDGVDSDCNGAIDDDADFESWYTDVDGDGWGTGDLMTTCGGHGGATVDGDCDDGVATINPAGLDADCDGLDQDCSGTDRCPAEALWITGSRATGLLDLEDAFAPDDTSCSTSGSTWMTERAGYDTSATYLDALVLQTGTRLHIEWIALSATQVDIPSLDIWGQPPVGSIDVVVPEADTVITLSADGEDLGEVTVYALEGDLDPESRACARVPHPIGTIPVAGTSPAMPTPQATCDFDPLNASSPLETNGCCTTVSQEPAPWSISPVPQQITFTASALSGTSGSVHRVYGYPTTLSEESSISLQWTLQQLDGDLWYRVGVLWGERQSGLCQLRMMDTTASPWFLDDTIQHWDFGAGMNTESEYPLRSIGSGGQGARVIPFIEVRLPEPRDADAELQISDFHVWCCGDDCGPRSGGLFCPLDYDGDGSAPWCGTPAPSEQHLGWDCNENDANATPIQGPALSNWNCNSPEWWDSTCPAPQ